jgi:hypothetical protein
MAIAHRKLINDEIVWVETKPEEYFGGIDSCNLTQDYDIQTEKLHRMYILGEIPRDLYTDMLYELYEYFDKRYGKEIFGLE